MRIAVHGAAWWTGSEVIFSVIGTKGSADLRR